MEQQIVIFELAAENYGVDIAAVESIIKIQIITKVPNAPSFVEGVTNLRGKVLPIIDLRKRFNLPLKEANKDTRIVVASVGTTVIGMVVDSVSEVLTIQDGDIEPTPSLVTTVDSAFITGIAKVEGRLVILLDLNMVLSAQEKSAVHALQSAVS
jgi:purine-binding chemotaxis protein CheW